MKAKGQNYAGNTTLVQSTRVKYTVTRWRFEALTSLTCNLML